MQGPQRATGREGRQAQGLQPMRSGRQSPKPASSRRSAGSGPSTGRRIIRSRSIWWPTTSLCRALMSPRCSISPTSSPMRSTICSPVAGNRSCRRMRPSYSRSCFRTVRPPRKHTSATGSGSVPAPAARGWGRRLPILSLVGRVPILPVLLFLRRCMVNPVRVSDPLMVLEEALGPLKHYEVMTEPDRTAAE